MTSPEQDPRTAPDDVPSARPLLLTVLGDLVLPTGGEAWLTTLTAAMDELGVTSNATRQALRRLVAQDIVQPERHGRNSRYALTGVGRRRLEDAAERIYLRRPLRWDGRWRILTYSFAEADRASRDALRRELAWLGYGALSTGMWICPWDLGARLDAVLSKHGVAGQVETFVSELEGDDRALAARAFDLSELRDGHRAFIATFEGQLDALDVDALTPTEALRARVLLVHAWRRFLFLDPGLPAELLPTDWLGERAGDIFLGLYRAYEGPAWERWGALTADAATEADAGSARPATSNLDAATDRSARRAGGDDAQRTEEFLARIHAGRKVEASDWMPATYRAMNIKFIEMHANSEIMGALPEREWIARAPSLRRKRSLAAKVQDEVGHAHLIYRIAEDLGKPRAQMYADLLAGRTKFHNVFHYPTHSWGDVACIGFLVDGAAIVTQRALLDTSYLPYVRVMRRVVAEESLHYRHGEDIMLALASGSDEQVAMLQEAVDRWWEPTMHFFGNDIPAEDDALIHWGIKMRANEDSRQEFLSQYVPKLWDMGIEVPDPTLRYDAATERWDYAEPDWDKLMAIVKGEPTPTTATRLGWRRLLHDEHAWIRRIVLGEDTLAEVA